MPANTLVTAPTTTTPDKLICSLDISAGGDLPISGIVTVPKLLVSYGRSPSTATIEIPLGGFNPAVLKDLLHGKRVSVDMIKAGKAVRMLNGNVVRDSSQINPSSNTLMVQVSDERISLNNFKVVGRVAVKENGVDPVYQMSQPSIFNRGGLRDGARTASGDILFATYPEWATTYAAGTAKITAINFSMADIFEYFRAWFVDSYSSVIRDNFPFMPTWPSTVIYPPGFAAGVDQSAWNGNAFQQGAAASGSDRNGREFSIDCVGFLDWVDAALDGSGVRMSLEPNGDQNEMVLVPLRPNQKAMNIVTNDPTIGPSDITFQRNSEDTLTQGTIVALPVEMETRVSEESEV